MAWDQEVDINFGEESQEDERDEHREADERSGRWWVDQSMKMRKMALGGGSSEDVWWWRSRARELFRSVAQARREPQCAAAVVVFLYSCSSSATSLAGSTAHGTITMAVPYSGDDVR